MRQYYKNRNFKEKYLNKGILEIKYKKIRLYLSLILYVILLTTSSLQISFIFFQFIPLAFADEITNGNYSIDIGTVDTNPQPSVKPVHQVLGTQSPKPEFTTGPDYTLNTSNDSFTITLLQNSIDYGILSSTNPVIRNSSFSFSDSQFGSQVFTYENMPLQSAKKDIIQNTSCDNGDCTPSLAAAWDDTLTYGFGYRCDSKEVFLCDEQFTNSDYYKPYPNDSINEEPEPITSDYRKNDSANATITYKVNISGTQKPVSYNNTIVYLAIPNF